MPFRRGEQDCVHFAAAAIEACTGTGVPIGADDALPDLYRQTCRRIGRPLANRGTARSGDIAMGPWGRDGGQALGVLLGGAVMVPGLNGLVKVPPALAARVWAIGERA